MNETRAYLSKKQVTQLSYDITGCAIEVHRVLGPGLLESVYEKCLLHELQHRGFKTEQQLMVPAVYKNIEIDTGLRLDLMVNSCVIVELKAVEHLLPIHEAQLMTYMKLLKKPQGLLINFHTENIVKSMKPFVNEYFRALPDG